MLEGESKQVPEAECVAAMAHALEACKKFQNAFEELRTLAGRPKSAVPAAPVLPALPDAVRASLRTALCTIEKQARREAIARTKAEWLATVADAERPLCDAAYEGAV